jgi:hypothetical protein
VLTTVNFAHCTYGTPYMNFEFSENPSLSLEQSDIDGRPNIWGLVWYRSLLAYSEEMLLAANEKPVLFLLCLARHGVLDLISTTHNCESRYRAWLRNDIQTVYEPYNEVRELAEGIEHAEFWFENFSTYVDIDDIQSMAGSVGQEVTRHIRNYRLALKRARRIEQLVRDQLQIQVGRLSLEESRRSIDEGKSTKTRMLTTA